MHNEEIQADAHGPPLRQGRTAPSDSDEASLHQSQRLPAKPPDAIWGCMTEPQREAYLAWREWYRDQLVDEERGKVRRQHGF